MLLLLSVLQRNCLGFVPRIDFQLLERKMAFPTGHQLHEKSQQQYLGLGTFTFLYASLVLHIPLQPTGVIDSINQTSDQRDKEDMTCPNL